MHARAADADRRGRCGQVAASGFNAFSGQAVARRHRLISFIMPRVDFVELLELAFWMSIRIFLDPESIRPD
jgi:hypothetical protein